MVGRPTDHTGSPTGTAADASAESVRPPELVRSLPQRDAIAAVTNPAFGDDWRGLSFEVPSWATSLATIQPRLFADDRVIGVVRDGSARAYRGAC